METLHDGELLALLLGAGVCRRSVRAIACALLEDAGSLSGLYRLGVHGLAAKRGVGGAKAARIMAALELGRRLVLTELSETRPPCGSFDAVVRWAQPRLACLDHEEVWVLSLDGQHGIKGTRRVAQGGLHGCAVTARDVLRPPLLDAASALVLVHNHPSGDPTPSDHDIRMTQAVAIAAEVVGLALLDHVIVARSGAESALARS